MLYALCSMFYAKYEMQDMRQESRAANRLTHGDVTLHGVQQGFFGQGLHG
jgi:hypothetical protein